MLDTVDFTNLDPWLAAPACNWEAAVETLMLSLAKHNVAILKLPSHYSDEMSEGMLAVAGLNLEETTDSDVAMPEEPLPQPEPYLLRDPSPRRNPPSPGLVQTHPGKLVCEHWEGLPLTTPLHLTLHMCNKTLERMARGVLQGLCRSCHMRLHSSTFLGLLEDLPLRENVRSCSTLQAVKYVRAANEAGPSKGPPLAWPLVQEGITPPGLVMVMKSQPAQDPDRECPVSKLQVKDRTGTWIDVPLAQDEVAVFLGKTAEVASSGLLKASTYRLVGELQKGSGHQNLEFHLCARPDANLDLSKQLEAAGHHLPERHADKDGMNDLVRQFSAVLTPQNQTPPNRIPGRGSSSMGSLEMHTIPSTELQNKSRKRLSGDVRRAPSPVTRSGKVARTSAGLVNREHRLRGRGSGAPDEAEPSMEHDCGPPGDADAEEVLCVTVDGQGVNTDRLLTLRMIYETTYTEVALRTHRKTSLARLFEVFCNTVGANLSTVKFMHNGERLSGNLTCRQLCDIDQPILVSDVDC